MSRRTLGIATANAFRLPLEVATETIAILAKRGAGKTYTAKVLAEELLEVGVPLVVLDPIGVWWGLRAGADGDPAGGYPITILGGDHGDLPLEADAGATIADLVVTERVPLVLDLSLFRKAEARRFVTAFAERLYRKNREALHLIVDEADAFAPQRAPKGDEARLLGAMEDLVRRGRARGIGLTLVTQRSAVLNKNVLTQAEVLVVLRTTGPQDRSAIDAWVEDHAAGEPAYNELRASLSSLAVGEAWVWSPALLGTLARIHVRTARTFDSSSTPKAGAKAIAPRALSPVDLEALSARMAASIERAAADDPKALKARVGELERALDAAARTTPPVTTVEVPVLGDDAIAAFQASIEVLERIAASLFDELTKALHDLAETVAPIADGIERARNSARVPTAAPTPVALPKAPTPARGPDTPDVELPAGARRLLEAIAAHPNGLTKAQAATLARLRVRGGTFGTYLSRLKTAGYVLVSGATVTPTELGIEAAGNPPPPDPQSTLDRWRDTLGAANGARRMLDELVATYPGGLTREALSERAGVALSGGSFGTYLSRLRGAGLVVERDGGIYATDLVGGAT